MADSENKKEICGTCDFCMPNGKGDSVCTSKYYGKVLTEEEINSTACDEYEPSLSHFTEK